MTGSTAETPTFAACLTPAGRGAIATIGLCGPRSLPVVRELFRPLSRGGAALPAAVEAGGMWVGRMEEHDGKLADEVVLVVKAITPEPEVEMHCHGGTEVVRWLLELLETRGIPACSWQEWLRRTVPDRLQAGAAAAMAYATTTRTAAVLADQYQGALRRAFDAVQRAFEGGDGDGACRLLGELLRRTTVGRRLTAPWRVAVSGAPNVGKSSLVNALAGYRRSIVAATPGTTRDVVTTTVAVDGWPVELSDTAGLREEAGALERQGIDLARSAAVAADLCLWVLDAAAEPVGPPDWLTRARKVHLVVNKIDLRPAWDLYQAGDAVRVSAETRQGLDDLCTAISRWLIPDPPPPGAAVPFTPELCALVEGACGCCRAGQLAEARGLFEAARGTGIW